MKKTPLKAWVQDNKNFLTPQDYCTNNAWGFSGSYGVEHVLPDGKTFIRIGRACFRRGPTEYIEYAGERLSERDSHYIRLTTEEFLKRV